ncbi:MAG: extracellular solute-binding protein [Anaerolineaceae bacterium]|nr:extracellular solute-binding protein [Anaerolineaceae bacterium]
MNVNKPFSIRLRNLFLTISLLSVVLLGGCEFQLDFRELVSQIVEQIVPPPAVTETPSVTSPTVESTDVVAVTPTALPLSGAVELVIWVPPQFDPQLDTPESVLFKQRIAEFEASHEDIFVTVRVKAVSGATGLLESLTITSAAASQAMPTLVALPRADLETAVSRNLIIPFDMYSSEIDNQDWYDYAQRLTVIGGSSYGLPFAGDAMVMVYRPSIVGEPPDTWNDLIRRGEAISLPAADPQSLLTFALYLSSGGDLESIQRLPPLDLKILTQLYQLYADGAQAGVFPLWLTEMQKDSEAWTAYNELRSNWVITRLTRHLSDPSDDSNITHLPEINDTPTTLADGWVWCLTDPRVQVHELSVELAEFLVEPDYLTEWTPLAGALPVRPSTLIGFEEQTLRTTLGQIALSAHIRPNNEIVNVIGLVMQDQFVQVLSGKTTAPFAAQAIIDRIGNP